MERKLHPLLQEQSSLLVSNVSLEASVHLFATFMTEQDSKDKTLPILVLPHDEKIQNARALLEFFKPRDVEILTFPNWDCLPYDRISPSKSVVAERLNTLSKLSTETTKKFCVITTMAALLQRLPPPSILQNRILSLRSGQTVSLEQAVKFLEENGFERLDVVTLPGQYAVRGGLLDIFPPGTEYPVRLDFFGDHLESLKTFDPETQLTLGLLSSLSVIPTTEIFLTNTTREYFRERYRKTFGIESTKDPIYEAISEGRIFPGQEHWMPYFYPQMVDFFTYCSAATFFLPQQSSSIAETYLDQVRDHFMARQSFQQSTSHYRPINPDDLYMQWKDVEASCKNKLQVFYTSLKDPKGILLNYGSSLDLGDFSKGRERDTRFKNYLQGLKKNLIIMAPSEGYMQHLKDYIGVPVKEVAHVEEVITSKGIFLTQCPLVQGFESEDFDLLSGEEVLGRSLQYEGHKKRKKVSSLFEIMTFQTGDLLVHRDYGVARYKGLKQLEVMDACHDCIELEYDKGDVLYVPVENMDVLSFYGSGGEHVALDRLGSSNWDLKKARTKKRIQDIAKTLVDLAARRQTKSAHVFDRERSAYHEFCRGFPYVETGDQGQAIQEVLEDLSRGKPMDRLLCGDVGFGKTEVALRAAFVVSQAGYQVALICPTTLLCAQHFNTFKRRFAAFSIRVESLSRVQKASEIEKIHNDLKNGEVNIIVGTHALLSSKIGFKNLGLVIVDEEQHFGVKQKEHLKNLVDDVHVLSMSATPIPRSLQMAVSGIRDMSIIATPPVDRLEVNTFVTPYDSVVIREAILREFHRGGQIFYVCPRIADLERMYETLSKLMPEVKIAMAHGGMPVERLEHTMQAFEDHGFDVLLATNIVESGLDIPNANTLIVHRADLLGLSQLYQLRGRVGRSKVRGYAYFTVTPDKTLTENALKRLEVIQNLEGLGGGFSLASRDMDIRGVGNLVGQEQSGHVKEVGVSLYHHMLEEAILEYKQGGAQKIEKTWSPHIHLGIEIFIPEAYLKDLNLRLSFYRRLSELNTREEAEDLKAEMIDRFGPLPQEVLNLFSVVHIKNLCKKLNLQKIEAGPKGILVTFFENKCPYIEVLLEFMTLQRNTIRLRPDHKLVILKVWRTPQDQLHGLTHLLRELRQLQK
jgi:transcription-repair coupling factor (superfamily II helicase)